MVPLKPVVICPRKSKPSVAALVTVIGAEKPVVDWLFGVLLARLMASVDEACTLIAAPSNFVSSPESLVS